MIIFKNLSHLELARLRVKLECIEEVTYDAWGTTHHARFQVPSEFSTVPGLPTIVGNDPRQFCNEPALLVQQLLALGSITPGCADPKVLHHYLTHKSTLLDPAVFLHGLADKLQCRVKPSGVETFEKVVRLEHTHLALYPDIHDTLPIIAANYQTSLASNLCQLSADRMMKVSVLNVRSEHVDVAPFGSYFQQKVFSFEEGETKPVLFNALPSKIPAGRRLVVGDNAKLDALAALEAGYAFAVLIDRTENPGRFERLELPDNVIYITEMQQLVQLLPRTAPGLFLP